MQEEVYQVLEEVNHKIMEYDGGDMLEDEIIESMEIMDIVVAMEEHFNIEVPPQLIVPEYFMTKETIVKLVEDSMKAQ